MKRIIKLVVIVITIILLFLALRFSFRRVKEINEKEILYCGNKYQESEIFCIYSFGDEKLKKVSFYWPFFSWPTFYYAASKNNPDIIIQPRGTGIYIRDDIDSKELECKCAIYDDGKYRRIGVFSLLDLIIQKEVIELENMQFETLCQLEMYLDNKPMIGFISDIIKMDNEFYIDLELNGESIIYSCSSNLIDALIDNDFI